MSDARPPHVDSGTWGELPNAVRALIICDMYDNMTLAEQRAWAIDTLAACAIDADRYHALQRAAAKALVSVTAGGMPYTLYTAAELDARADLLRARGPLDTVGDTPEQIIRAAIKKQSIERGGFMRIGPHDIYYREVLEAFGLNPNAT